MTKDMKNIIRKLYREKHYRDIITLLELFQYHEKGISQKHFRYVLMNEPELDPLTTAEVKKFFERAEYLLNLFERNGSRKGSITTQKNLNYYLKYLYKNNIIEKMIARLRMLKT